MKTVLIFLLFYGLNTVFGVPKWCNLLSRWKHQFSQCQETGCNPACTGGETCMKIKTLCGKPNCSEIAVCKPVACSLDKNVGFCQDAKTRQNRFFYNRNSQECESFEYTGCFGNENNFRSIGDCQKTCQPDKKPTVSEGCSPPCQANQKCLEYQANCIGKDCKSSFTCVENNQKELLETCAPLCSVGEKCVKENVICVKEPCKPIYSCVPVCDPRCRADQKCVQKQIHCVQAPCDPVWVCEDERSCPLLSMPKDPIDRPNCQYQKVKRSDGCDGFELICRGYCPAVLLNKDCFGVTANMLCRNDADCSGDQKCCYTDSCGSKGCVNSATSDTCNPACKSGEECVKERAMCSMKSPTCRSKWVCKKAGCTPDCELGYKCVQQNVNCVKAPCPTIFDCVLDESVDVCTLPKVTGPCKASFNSWYFNSATKQCEEFIYGGCLGNNNRFSTKDVCQSVCGSKETVVPGTCPALPDINIDCQVVRVFSNCDTDANCSNKVENTKCCPGSKCGGKICKKPTLKKACQLPVVSGPCEAYMPSFYFNTKTSKCESFVYGGCNGNDNRFTDKQSCERVCLGIDHLCPVPMMTRPPTGCHYDTKTLGDNGCPTYKLICSTPCPLPAIQPPKGCSFDTKTLNAEGCPTYTLFCPHCPMPGLVAPPDGCKYDMDTRGSNGCKTYELICEGFCPPYAVPAIVPDCSKVSLSSNECKRNNQCIGKEEKKCCPSGPCGEMSCQKPLINGQCNPVCAADETCVEESVICVKAPCNPVWLCKKKQNQVSPPNCPVPKLIAPPANCEYDNKQGEDGCPVYYLVCADGKCSPVQVFPLPAVCANVDVRVDCSNDKQCSDKQQGTICCPAGPCGGEICKKPIEPCSPPCNSNQKCVAERVYCVRWPCPKQYRCKNFCKGTDFSCDDGKTCIQENQVCDGQTQCTDGTDEAACNDWENQCDPSCAANQVCVKEAVQCAVAPCNPVYTCKTDPCDGKCKQDETCKRNVLCWDGVDENGKPIGSCDALFKCSRVQTIHGDSCNPDCAIGQTCVQNGGIFTCKTDPCDGRCSISQYCKREVNCQIGGQGTDGCATVFQCVNRGCDPSCATDHSCVQQPTNHCFPDGNCQPHWQCSKCSGSCGENEECAIIEVNCFRPPCQPIYECRPYRCNPKCQSDERCVSIPCQSQDCVSNWKCQKMQQMRCPSFDEYTMKQYKDCNRLATPPLTCNSDQDCNGSDKVKCCQANPCGGKVCKPPLILDADTPINYCEPACGPNEKCVKKEDENCPPCNGAVCKPCPYYYICQQATCDPACGPEEFCIKNIESGQSVYTCEKANDEICPPFNGLPNVNCNNIRLGNFCNSDSECDGIRSKCCKATICGGTVCKKPIKTGHKPGLCPAIEGTAGICTFECTKDSDCTGKKKCCSDHCGHKCKIPIAE